MSDCSEMKKGDLFVCNSCGLQLKVQEACSCGQGDSTCNAPLQCCGEDMVKK